MYFGPKEREIIEDMLLTLKSLQEDMKKWQAERDWRSLHYKAPKSVVIDEQVDMKTVATSDHNDDVEKGKTIDAADDLSAGIHDSYLDAGAVLPKKMIVELPYEVENNSIHGKSHVQGSNLVCPLHAHKLSVEMLTRNFSCSVDDWVVTKNEYIPSRDISVGTVVTRDGRTMVWNPGVKIALALAICSSGGIADDMINKEKRGITVLGVTSKFDHGPNVLGIIELVLRKIKWQYGVKDSHIHDRNHMEKLTAIPMLDISDRQHISGIEFFFPEINKWLQDAVVKVNRYFGWTHLVEELVFLDTIISWPLGYLFLNVCQVDVYHCCHGFLDWPAPDIFPHKSHFKEEACSSLLLKFEIFITPEMINIIRDLLQKRMIVATHTDSPVALSWEVETQPRQQAVLGVSDSCHALALNGHRATAEFALPMYLSGFYVLFGGKDTSVVLRSVQNHTATCQNHGSPGFAAPINLGKGNHLISRLDMT
ncbi:hypothetical protein ACHQM5_025445 [Ranunculus cassubicifolius]